MARFFSIPGSVALVCLWLIAAACAPATDHGGPRTGAATAEILGATVEAPDGVPIVYDVRGAGETTLLFVHCWSCNRGFWREQIEAFDDDYRVVTLDLGGHGESGSERDGWTILGLGQDVVAVADALDLDRIVLVGHSMGGSVVLEAARLMPGRTLGVVVVDTLQDADFEFPEEQSARFVAAFEEDFEKAMRGMFTGLAAERMDDELRSWIVEEAVAARSEVAVALLKDFQELDVPSMFREAGVPIRAVNASESEALAPTNVEANRKYADFDAVIIDGVGHFLQLEEPGEFNDRLRSWVEQLAAR